MRADEQALVALNDQNLMFVEDAARRLQAALNHDHANACIRIRHTQTPHPPDAVARACSAVEGVIV